MESLRVLLLAVGLAVIVGVVASALFHVYESSMHGQALAIVEEVYGAVSTVGTSIIHTEYPICVVNGSNTVSIVLPRSKISFKVPKIGIGSTCCVGNCMIVSSGRTFRLTIGNLTMRSIVTYVPHSNRTRVIIHRGGMTCTVRCVHVCYCRQVLDIRLVSSGFCGVDYSFRVISQVVCVGENCTYSIGVIYPPNLAKYIGVFGHSNRSIIIGLEDCSCCDFDKRDEILNITVLRNMTYIIILRSKGGFSHRLYINNSLVYYKPPGVYKTNIDLGNYPMKCILKKHCYETYR